jgi:hypothetical protein
MWLALDCLYANVPPRLASDWTLHKSKPILSISRFPVPEDEQHQSTDDFPGLVRAADLIGQLADINYLRKQTALFEEFRETGVSEKLGYNCVADLRSNYPDFFWKMVRPYIGYALRYLRATQEGQQWIANLYANVFSAEHRSQLLIR